MPSPLAFGEGVTAQDFSVLVFPELTDLSLLGSVVVALWVVSQETWLIVLPPNLFFWLFMVAQLSMFQPVWSILLAQILSHSVRSDTHQLTLSFVGSPLGHGMLAFVQPAA